MTKTAVHVTTIEEWNAVLGVWFKQGRTWVSGEQEYSEDIFENGGRYLYLGSYITWSNEHRYATPSIEYSEFMTQKAKPLIPMDILYI